LRNSPDSKIFPDSLKNLRVFYFSTIGNREISQINREFPRFPSFWGTPQIPKLLGNSPDFQAFGEFHKFPGIWGISNFDNFLIAATPSLLLT